MSRRSFLFLQGVCSPFFFRLADQLADGISKFYAVRIEPLIFGIRRRRRLLQFGLLEHMQVLKAQLDFGHSISCRGQLCEPLVRRYDNYYRRFSHIRFDQPCFMQGSGILAILDLRNYDEYQDYLRQLSKKSGNFYRDANQARRKGYAVHQFQYQNHTPDICEIRKSLKTRSFGPVIDAFVLTVEALGGAPETLHPLATPQCPKHWEIFFGVFIAQPGYMQGNLTLNEKLVAYARLHRIGNTIRYAEFIGHGNHMQNGVMMLLHNNMIEWLLDASNTWARGVCYVTFGAIEQGNEGLLFWKKKALFVPHILLS